MELNQADLNCMKGAQTKSSSLNINLKKEILNFLNIKDIGYRNNLLYIFINNFQLNFKYQLQNPDRSHCYKLNTK